MATDGAEPGSSHHDSLASSAHPSLFSDGVSAETLEGTHDGRRPIPPRTRTAGSLPLGFTVGRYVVLTKLGAGGMGVVYAAHDPELDRRVALKLMRARGSADRIARGHRRLLAEAQALARLNDPHVVTVHDVGEHDGQVFVAMEFIEGCTLAAWLRRARRSWSEVLDVMLQAGRGMVAAHARELVHCDLKPDNVMVGDDGRVRVMDFGLAQAADGAKTEDDGDAAVVPTLDPTGTRTQGLVGTPAYMAPEQLAGGRGTMASDQFSFCVAMWEALHGCRPFVGETLPELVSKILAGAIREPSGGRRVPGWLRRTVERGMATDPARRWPSMAALLAALERGRARARWRRGLLVVGLVGVVGAAGLAWQRYDRAQQVRACEEEGATIAEVWSEGQAAALREAMVGTGVSHAEVTAGKVIPWLDDHAGEWRASRTAVCVAAEVEHTWDADMLDRSLWCLEERRRDLQALVAALQRGEPRMTANAVRAAASLHPIGPCQDELTLSRQPAPPHESREEIIAVKQELLRAGALERAGQYDESLAVGRAALERAEALGWPPLVAAARRSIGRSHLTRGEYEEAHAVLEQTFFEAARADAFEEAAQAAGELSAVIGDRLARPREGLLWARWQELMVMRLHDPSGLFHARALDDRALMHLVMGEHQEAMELYERVASIQERALGADHPMVGKTIGSLAIVIQEMGDHERAKALNERALVVEEQALGPDHPDVAIVLHNLARDYRALGDARKAVALYERALAIWEASLGPEHPHVAQVLNNLGNASHDLGEHERAIELHQRALALRERIFGPEHPQVAQSLSGLTLVELATTGASEAMVARCERAVAILERTLGPEHPDVAEVASLLGRALLELGRLDQAQVQLERAIGIWDGSVGAEHPSRAYTLEGLALLALAQGRPGDAVEHARQGLRIRTAGGAPAVDVAQSRFVLAKALRLAGQDEAEARALATQARDGFREHGHTEQANEADAWLASHRVPEPGG